MKNNIEKFREEQGWSQRQLAIQAGISNTTLGNIEAEISDPRLETAAAIADALEKTLYDVFPEL